jgi:hypothetical protein
MTEDAGVVVNILVLHLGEQLHVWLMIENSHDPNKSYQDVLE